jgi:hypothetical protein
MSNPAFDLVISFFSEHKNGDKRFSEFHREGSNSVQGRCERHRSGEDSLEDEQGQGTGKTCWFEETTYI